MRGLVNTQKLSANWWYFVEGRGDLLQSNPVLWIDCVVRSLDWDSLVCFSQSAIILTTLLEHVLQKHHLPSPFLCSLYQRGMLNTPLVNQVTRQRLGIVGLVANNSQAFVVPLAIRRQSEWEIDPHLPAKTADIEVLWSQFVRFTNSAEMLPERYCFRISTPLREVMSGRSMDLAILVSIIDSLQQQPVELLSCCCVLGRVESDGKVVSSDFIEQKLRAFLRENGRGTLLIRPADCIASAEFDCHFDRVLSIRNLGDLVRGFQTLGLLDSIFSSAPPWKRRIV